MQAEAPNDSGGSNTGLEGAVYIEEPQLPPQPSPQYPRPWRLVWEQGPGPQARTVRAGGAMKPKGASADSRPRFDSSLCLWPPTHSVSHSELLSSSANKGTTIAPTLGKIGGDGYRASGLEPRTQEVLPSDTPATSHDGPEDHTPTQRPAGAPSCPWSGQPGGRSCLLSNLRIGGAP